MRSRRWSWWTAELERKVREGTMAYDPTTEVYSEVIPPDDIPERATIDSMVAHWERCHKIFLESKWWVANRDVLTRYLTTNAIPKITSVVCVALGSLSGHSWRVAPDRKDTTYTSLYQLIELLSVLEVFGLRRPPADITAAKLNPHTPTETNQNAIPIYAQEPRFNELDKELLVRLGITVVEDPKIWAMIDSETLAYSPGAEQDHYRKIAEKNLQCGGRSQRPT